MKQNNLVVQNEVKPSEQNRGYFQKRELFGILHRYSDDDDEGNKR